MNFLTGLFSGWGSGGKSPVSDKGVPYGPLPRQVLDLYVPGAQHKIEGILVFIYGGSWQSGDRGLYGWLGGLFAKHGYVTVIPDYRLYPSVVFPAFVEDGAQAIAWVTREASRRGWPAHVHVMGHSAGAHIAALLGLDGRYLRAVGRGPRTMRSVIALAGPHSMNPLNYPPIEPIFSHLGDINQARPVKLVHGSAPPMLIAHGTADVTVDVRNSRFLHDALTKVGSEAELRLYPNLGHMGIILSLLGPLRWRAPVFEDCLDFLEKHRGRQSEKPR